MKRSYCLVPFALGGVLFLACGGSETAIGPEVDAGGASSGASGGSSSGAASSSSSGASSGASGSSGTSGDGGGSSSSSSGSGGPVTCVGKTAPAKVDEEWSLDVKGEKRTVRVHVPASYKPANGTPLVLNFHGYTSSNTEQETWSKMLEKSDKEGFIVLHPQGTGLLKGWNAGACCGDAQTKKVDDVAFTKAMLDEAEKRLCIDTKRVYSTGMSNGGFMSYRLACEMSDRIAAIAPVAGLSTVVPCTPGRPVPVMHFHGTSDTIVPYNGGGISGYPKAADSIADWVKRNKCTGAAVETFNQGDAKCMTNKTCDGGAEVTFCTLTGGGHTWPGGTPMPVLGTTNKDISATDAMWDFFKAHPLP